MSDVPAAAPGHVKIRLLALTMGMEIYTVGVSLIGMMTSNSVVFLANFVIALTGALASGLSLYTVKKMSGKLDLRNTFGYGRFETLSSIVVGLTMAMAALFIAYEALMKVLHPVHQHGGLVAILLTTVSLALSLWLWIRNLKLSHTDPSPIFGAIWRLARMGALEDLLIILAVGISLLLPDMAWTRYLDVVATTILLVIMIISIRDVFSGSAGELMDRSLEEYTLIRIMGSLAAEFNNYEQIHGLRTRRSGSQVFVEIFLEFDPLRALSDVYELTDRLKQSVGLYLPTAQVMVIPVRTEAESPYRSLS